MKKFSLFYIFFCVQPAFAQNDSWCDTLNASIIFPQEKLCEIVKKASRRFNEKYCHEALANIIYSKEISCMNQCREFIAVNGLLYLWNPGSKVRKRYFDDRGRLDHEFLPITTMRSSPWAAADDVELEESSIHSPSLLTGFSNHPFIPDNIMNFKRMIEMHSPINKYQITNFKYFFVHSTNEFICIEFETRDECFPNQCKLYGKGRMTLRSDNYSVVQIELVDFQETFCCYLYRMGIFPLATRHRLVVQYQEDEKGVILPGDICLEVEWPGELEARVNESHYAVKRNSRRQPYKVGLCERQYVHFVRLERPTIGRKEIRNNLSYANGFYTFFLAKYDSSYWNTISMPWLNMTKIRRDLQINGETLHQQAVRQDGNGMYYTSFFEELDIEKAHKSYVRKKNKLKMLCSNIMTE